MPFGDQGSNPAVGSQLRVRTTLPFDAFYARRQEVWVRYAETHTGSREAAEQIADAVTVHMAEIWPEVRGAQDADQHAWQVLKDTVTHWLEECGAGSAFVATAAFERVEQALAWSRDRLAVMAESLGLYSAISRLTGRQYDAIVLHFVLGYPYSTVADLLGVSESTVRSNVRHAKKNLAEDLGLPHLIGNEG